MSDEKAFWPGWETVRLIGRGSFGAVYEIQRKVFDDVEKAALKVISIPQNDSDLDEMYSDGYDSESITATFQAHLKSIVAEYSLMRKMNGSANIVNCDDVRYVQHDDGIGWDIFIKMELLTPLTKALPNEVPEEVVIRIARDMCAALELCKRHEIVHRDIKPQNIFVSPNGDYKLGDFGIAKTVEKTMGGTKIGTYKYMAPEVYNNQPYGSSADIYSLGLVLYWMLNERRMPFMPLPPEKLRAGADEDARQRRLSGEQLPAPAHGSDELKRIVLKACAYDPKDRYASAEAMLDDLVSLGAGKTVKPKEPVVTVPYEENDDLTAGPIFGRNSVQPPHSDLTDSTVGPKFIPTKVEEKITDSSGVAATDSSTQNKMQSGKLINVALLVALWLASIVFSVWVLADVPMYVPHILGASKPWIYLSLATGWIVPLLAVLSLYKPKGNKFVKKVCKISAILQAVFALINVFMAIVPIFPAFMYRICPGAITLEEFYVVATNFNEWVPLITCLIAHLILILKDVLSSYTTKKAEAEESEEQTVGLKISLIVVASILALMVIVLLLRADIFSDNNKNTNDNVGPGNNIVTENRALEFECAETEQAFRDLLGIPAGKTIYLQDVAHIERICFVNDDIIVNEWSEFGSSSGYGYWDSNHNEYLVEHDGNWQYTNKIQIDLRDMQLLPNLQEIVINNAEITNLRDLALCPRLSILKLNYCETVDLNEISRWQNIEELTISGCNNLVSGSTSNTNRISKLQISGTFITNFDQLANFTKLTDLSLGLGIVAGGTSNSISVETLDPDLDFLGLLPNLESLSLLDGGSISDISPVANLKKLKKLELTYFTAVRDISPIGQLTNLEELRFVQMGSVDYSEISKLKKLTLLEMPLCRFQNIQFVSELTNLTSLDVSQTGVNDITPLTGLTKLTDLDIRDANIDDLSPIAHLDITYIVVDNSLREQAKSLFPEATVMG